MKEISIDDILLVLSGDVLTGKLFWRERPLSMFGSDRIGKGWNAKYANTAALNHISSGGYLCGNLFGRHTKAHRVVFAIHYGKWPDGEIDHINGQKLDNRISNLRDISHQENIKNQRRKTLVESGFSGVYWHKNRWYASIKTNTKQVYLGSFIDKELAIAARSKALVENSYDENHCKAAAYS